MNEQIPENLKIAPFLLFYLIHAMQVGVGILGFQRIISLEVGHDGWISVIVVGIAMLLILWMMFKILNIAGTDLLAVNEYIIGKKASKLVGLFFMFYFILLAITVVQNYIETLQVWMFPELRGVSFAVPFFLLAIYNIYGGIKTIAGIAFFSVVLPLYVLPLFLMTLPLADFLNFSPVFSHSVTEILNGSRQMSFTVIGFEILLFIYPFLNNKKKAKKWGYLAIGFTTLSYLYLTIIAFSYFPIEQLEKNIWPTLTMWKIIQLPFVERFEYIGIATWCLIILPNACIALWISSRLAKQIFKIRQKRALWIISVLCLVPISILSTREQIDMLTNITGTIGFYINFVYVPFLFIAAIIAKRVKNREKNQ